ncbi:hypothetical protein OROMI_015842 [Orobanche minor]
MASTNDESGSSSKKTVAKRGVTRLQKIHKAKSSGKRTKIEWNERGQPIKHDSKGFASFIGLTVRRLVPISLDSWSAIKNKAAVDTYKQNIWDEVQKAYIIGDEHRDYVLREAGRLHRAFRTKMASLYLQKISKANRERALNPQYTYRKSRLGIARLEADMMEELEFENLKASSIEEEREDLGPSDILFEALNLPNYSGRVRSYGFGVCKTALFPCQTRPTPMDLEKLYGICNTLRSRVEVLEREKLERQQTSETYMQQPEKVAERQPPEKVAERHQPEELVKRRKPKEVVERQQPSDKASCNPASFGNIPQGLFPVNIYLASPSRCLVARGKLYNTKGNTVHGMTLPPGYVKIKIEVSVVPNALLPISVEYGDVTMVSQAIGTIVPWPLQLLEFVRECEKFLFNPKTKIRMFSEVWNQFHHQTKAKNKTKFKSPPKLAVQLLLQICRSLKCIHKMLRAGSLIKLNTEENIFGEEFSEQLLVENIEEIIDHSSLSACIITVFARYLYDKFISPNGLISKFSFISPHVSRDDNQGKAIANILLKDNEVKDRIIFAPCNLASV